MPNRKPDAHKETFSRDTLPQAIPDPAAAAWDGRLNPPGQFGKLGGQGFLDGHDASRRTDARIRDEAVQCLRELDHVDTFDVDVQVHEGQITLGGTVRSRDDKTAIETALVEIEAVRSVVNGLRVVAPRSESAS